MARTILRVQKKQQRVIDDFLFLFACTCLIAATILLVKEASSIYTVTNLVTRLISGSSLGNQVAASPLVFEHTVAVIQSDGYAYSVLIWVTIFAIKFYYLCFFRMLIDRLKSLVLYWRVTMSITTTFATFNICALFIACPYFGQKARKLPSHFPKFLPVWNHTVRFSIDV